MDDKTPYPQKARARIQATRIIDKLQRHIDGEVEMQPTQINAARILLGKCVPDVKQTEHTGEVTNTLAIDKQSAEAAARNILEIFNSIRA